MTHLKNAVRAFLLLLLVPQMGLAGVPARFTLPKRMAVMGPAQVTFHVEVNWRPADVGYWLVWTSDFGTAGSSWVDRSFAHLDRPIWLEVGVYEFEVWVIEVRNGKARRRDSIRKKFHVWDKGPSKWGVTG